MKDEGVIKFNCNWIQDEPLNHELIRHLDEWRNKLYALELIGVTPDGIGYGNISIRYHQNQFIITGSGTGSIQHLTAAHYTLVTEYDIAGNSLTTVGPVKASSESLTHASIYEYCTEANAVLHVHHNGLWKHLLHTLPATGGGVPYGTPEMAGAVQQLFREHNLATHKIFAMSGHEDGVICFDINVEAAGKRLLQHFGSVH